MANIDTLRSVLYDTADAIREKTGRSALIDFPDFPDEVRSIEVGGNAPNPDDPLLLVDWDGTLLYSYTAEEIPLISEFPDPPTHELLTFQEWSRAEVIAKTWVQKHPNGQLKVGAIYKSSDNQDHNYWHSPSWRNPSLSDLYTISMQKRSATSINSSQFRNYQSLSKINLPRGTTVITANAFQDCDSLSTIIFPRGLTTIEGSAFKNCASLLNVIVSDSLTVIGDSAFENCHTLTLFNFPNGLTTIGNNAFLFCSSLYKAEIPASVTQIGSSAFYSCITLADVVLHGKPTLGGSTVFYNNPSIQRIYVHRADLSWFETATNWSAIYEQPGRIVAAADYIEYLQSIGIDTSDFEGE